MYTPELIRVLFGLLNCMLFHIVDHNNIDEFMRVGFDSHSTFT